MPIEKFTDVSFYIVAHADDWQLFMQPNVYNDLVAPYKKVVFIITTAGDAGATKAFWSAREEGSKSSIRFCLAPLGSLSESTGTRLLNNHTINYFSINNAACYFLQLPDGNLDGKGFSTYRFQSLSRLRSKQIATITTVDDSATYSSWSDFYTTLEKIIMFESEGISNVCINYLNPATDANPNDHTDHIMTGLAIQEIKILSGIQQALFVGYSVSSAGEYLYGTDLFWKTGMFAAYEKALFDSSGYSTIKESINIYLGWCLSKAKFITSNP